MKITLAQAMQMGSGIRPEDMKAKELIMKPAQLKEQAEIQAYLTRATTPSQINAR